MLSVISLCVIAALVSLLIAFTDFFTVASIYRIVYIWFPWYRERH